MTVVVRTAANVAPPNEFLIEHRNYRAAAALTAGQVAIWTAAGYATPTTTAPAALAPIAGLAMIKVGPSMNVELFQKGFIAGWDVSGLAYFALLYAGATGEIDTAGNVVIGKVLPFSHTGEKMAYIDVTRSWLFA